MSKGIGRLQRRILETLEEAKVSGVYYRGDGDGIGLPDADEPGWVRCWRKEGKLPEDVFDLRCSARYLAEETGRMQLGRWPTSGFNASFSRAVRGLIRRGLLEPVSWFVFASHWPWLSPSVLARTRRTYRDGSEVERPLQTRFVRKCYGRVRNTYQAKEEQA